jgi:2-keto-4-pentenoate hydratase/2-oxohepta-3-ene-1,7-dioic acid hydratase in catechol pathway
MKIARFKIKDRTSYGVVIGDGIVDVGARMSGTYADVVDVLRAGALNRIAEFAAGRIPDHKLDDVQFLPPVRGPNAVLAVGRNYGSAYEDMGTKFPGHPSIFMRRYEAQAGHRGNLVRPKASHLFDGEAELALVIGPTGNKPGRHIKEADAFDHIVGYSIFNDGTLVDWGDHTARNVTPGKNFFASGAFGPWMVTADEIGDPTQLTILHRINGEEVQRGSTSEMIFSIPAILAYLSEFCELEPGDVITTGSPGGIRPRRDRGLYYVPGDRIEMEIDKIGVLENIVVDEA